LTTIVVNTGGKIAAGVFDTPGKLTARVIDKGGKVIALSPQSV
jgi:hypothetical protein